MAVVASVATAASFADAHHPEERLSSAVGTLSGPTYQAVVDGVGAATGRDGRYVVRWSDAADIGSPGFGLLDELERRGLDVAADEYFHVPVTEHRVRARAEADAQIHLATGGYVDVWRGIPDAVEVASFDPRTPAERDEYTAVRSRLVDRLGEEGLGRAGPAGRHEPVRHVRRRPSDPGRPGRSDPAASIWASRWWSSSPRLRPTTIRTRRDPVRGGADGPP